MSASDPRVLTERVKQVRSASNRVLSLYRWAYPMGYERAVRDSERVTISGVRGNDDMLVSTHRMRRSLEEADKAVVEALNKLETAERNLRHTMGQADPREGFTPLRFPRTATRADLAEAREAKDRRRERGEALP